MRYLFLSILSFLLLSATAQQQELPLIQLAGEFANADTSFHSMSLLTIDGISLKELASLPLKVKDGKAELKVNLKDLPAGIYFLAIKPQDLKMLYLGEANEIMLTGSCLDLRNAIVQNSPVNTTMARVLATSDNRQAQANNLARQMQMAADAASQEQIRAQMLQIDIQRTNTLDSLKNVMPFVGKVLALKTYLSFIGSGTGARNEYEYFALNYFKFVDFTDPDFNRMLPILHESVKAYATGMGQVPFSTTAQRDQLLEDPLRKMQMGGPAFKTALIAMVTGLQESGEEESFLHFAQNYTAMFKGDNIQLDEKLAESVNMYSNRRVGGMAPEIAQPTPTGEIYKLSDMRGKVVLIDFWASWCRPCRQENPNVVAAYNKYRAKGFDILGVSLDQNAEAWKKAIAQDGLPWHHVSDLRQWQSEPGRIYGVRSIPHSVLVDKDGKIIAKNLRGEELERKLAEIFGE